MMPTGSAKTRKIFPREYHPAVLFYPVESFIHQEISGQQEMAAVITGADIHVPKHAAKQPEDTRKPCSGKLATTLEKQVLLSRIVYYPVCCRP